jgi:hypothetical protein
MVKAAATMAIVCTMMRTAADSRAEECWRLSKPFRRLGKVSQLAGLE